MAACLVTEPSLITTPSHPVSWAICPVSWAMNRFGGSLWAHDSEGQSALLPVQMPDMRPRSLEHLGQLLFKLSDKASRVAVLNLWIVTRTPKDHRKT